MGTYEFSVVGRWERVGMRGSKLSEVIEKR